MRLVSFQAYNGGPVSTIVSLSCPGQPLTRVTLAAGQLATIATTWVGPCPTVTLSADSAGWTTFDNFLLYPSGSAG